MQKVTACLDLAVGDGEKKSLTTGTDLYPAFSPDGKWVVFTRYADDVALWRVSMDGREPGQLTNNVFGYLSVPAVSPDGKHIAFHLPQNSRSKYPNLLWYRIGREHTWQHDIVLITDLNLQ